jgi:hypothetical protein
MSRSPGADGRHSLGDGHVGPQARRWERIAPAGALGFLLLLLIGAVILGEPPPPSHAPTQEIASYFAEHRSGVLYNSAFAMLGAFALYPWFLGSLYRAARRAEGDGGIFAVVATIGGVSLLGPLLLQAAGWGAAALEAGPRRDPSVAASLMDLGNMGFLLVPLPAALLVAATTLAARPGILLPAWLTRAGLPVAVALVGGGLVGFAPQLLFILLALWLAAVAAVLMRRAAPRLGDADWLWAGQRATSGRVGHSARVPSPAVHVSALASRRRSGARRGRPGCRP